VPITERFEIGSEVLDGRGGRVDQRTLVVNLAQFRRSPIPVLQDSVVLGREEHQRAYHLRVHSRVAAVVRAHELGLV
jgi:hypothetical protein